ncbi:MAG: VanZ family protein [Clostridia bacterium]|nr:VanZ family protein [Clostridia bacterium]
MKSSRKIYILISWVLVLICMTIIFSLSAQNGEESSELSGSFVMDLLNSLGINIDEGMLRTIAHCLEFMGLSLLMFNAVYSTWQHKLTHIIAFAGTVLYAITDEFHQLFVPDRAFQFVDILVDSTGALIGVTVSVIILKIILKKRGNINGNT